MNVCPHCKTDTLVKAGLNPSGSQRYQCKVCQHYTTLAQKPHGYDKSLHTQALRLYLEGNGLRQIGRLLGITHQTAANWLAAAEAQLPNTPPQPTTSETIELDELFTFIGTKKTKRSSSRR